MVQPLEDLLTQMDTINKSEQEQVRYQNLKYELERIQKEFNDLMDEIRNINKRNTDFMASEFKNLDNYSSRIKQKKQVQSKQKKSIK